MGENLIERVVVFGAGGYIGSKLCFELQKWGYVVVAVDRKKWDFKLMKSFKGEFVEADVLDFNSDVFRGADTVINLAARTPERDWSSKEFFEVNCLAAVELAKKAKADGVKRYLFASSTAVLGKSEYGFSKLLAEKNLKFLNSKNFVVTVFRIGNCFGFSPVMRWSTLINSFVHGAIFNKKIVVRGNVNALRPVVFIDDVVRAFQWGIKYGVNETFCLVEGSYPLLVLAERTGNALRKQGLELGFELEDALFESYEADGRPFSKASKLNFVPLNDSLDLFALELKENGFL